MNRLIGMLATVYLFISRYILSFGRRPFPGIPHATSINPLGFIGIKRNSANQLIALSKATSNGLASLWIGGIIQALYITDNETRRILQREGTMGVTNDMARNLHFSWFKNYVMINFLVWQNINSDMYKSQRRFLDRHFVKDVAHLLPTVENAIVRYTNQYTDKKLNLRQFIYGLTLHIGSRLPVIGLSKHSIDEIFHANPQFEEAVYYIAQYGTSKMGDAELENFLFEQFSILVKNNYDEIRDSEHNLLRNIFESRELEFSRTYEEFQALDQTLRHHIAMNFLSVAIGGMIHTTANSFDWLMARLSKQPAKMAELNQLVQHYADLDLTDKTIFEKELRPVRDFVMENVLLNPTFTHEYFVAEKPFDAILPNGQEIHINQYDLLIVNYLECNRSEKYNKDPIELKLLFNNHNTQRISMDKHVASFGGSDINSNNHKTRICPGRVFSLFEQMIMLTELLKNFDLTIQHASCTVDDTQFPLHGRVNEGTIVIRQKIKNESQQVATQSPITHLRNTSSVVIEQAQSVVPAHKVKHGL
jgi:hypothetical protein